MRPSIPAQERHGDVSTSSSSHFSGGASCCGAIDLARITPRCGVGAPTHEARGFSRDCRARLGSGSLLGDHASSGLGDRRCPEQLPPGSGPRSARADSCTGDTVGRSEMRGLPGACTAWCGVRAEVVPRFEAPPPSGDLAHYGFGCSIRGKVRFVG